MTATLTARTLYMHTLARNVTLIAEKVGDQTAIYVDTSAAIMNGALFGGNIPATPLEAFEVWIGDASLDEYAGIIEAVPSEGDVWTEFTDHTDPLDTSDFVEV